MKKFINIFFLLFLFFSFKVYARWTEVSSDKETTYYIDMTTLEITSMTNTVSFWNFEIYTTELLTGTGVKSSINNMIFDCDTSKYKYLNSFYFSDQTAKNLYDYFLIKDEKWSDIIENSHFDIIKNKIC